MSITITHLSRQQPHHPALLQRHEFVLTMFFGVQFMQDHVQMQDVRLYIRDVLKEYASLQTATEIKPSWNAICYTGQLVLDQFAFPYRLDKQVVVQAYPWLTSFGQDLCPASTESSASAESAVVADTALNPLTRKLQ